jgi:hypothetical protein
VWPQYRRVPTGRFRSAPRSVVNVSSRDMCELVLGQLIRVDALADVFIRDLVHNSSFRIRSPGIGLELTQGSAVVTAETVMQIMVVVDCP